MPKRFDGSRIDSIEKTPQGGYRIPARLTRVGVFTYRNSDGSVRKELRRPEEVFRTDSLATLLGAPITDLHPPVPVTPDNWKQFTVGHVGESVGQEGIYVAAPLMVQDRNTLGLIERGERKEISCGYDCDIDATPGSYEGQPYDVEQKNIRYNHVALGPPGWGRAGPGASLRLDSGDAVAVDSSTTNEDPLMKTIRIDGVDYEVGSEAHLQAQEKHNRAQEARLAEAQTQIGKLSSDLGAATARADSADKRAKDAEEALKKATDPKSIQALVQRRVDMLDKGRRVAKLTGKRFDEDAPEEGGGEGGMLLQILKMIEPDFSPEGRSPEFIQGYAMAKIASLLGKDAGGKEEDSQYDSQKAQAAAGGVQPPAAPGRSDSIFDARRKVNKAETESETERKSYDPAEAEKKMRKDSAEAWNQPLAYSK